MLEIMCKTAYDHKDYYRSLLHYKGHNSLADTIVSLIHPLNLELYEKRIDSNEERDFVAYMFAWIHSILLFWWLDEENDTDPKTMAKYLERWAFSHWREIDHDKFLEDNA
jgi:hypothetical protein